MRHRCQSVQEDPIGEQNRSGGPGRVVRAVLSLSRTLRVAGLLIALLGTSVGGAYAETAADYAVRLTATVRVAPPQIQLSWPADAGAGYCNVFRKAYSDQSWTPLANLPGNASSYSDDAVAVGVPYEYRVIRGSAVTAYGYLAAGIRLPLVDARGKVVLIVDATHAGALSAELSRFERDLVGDGWQVLRHDVLPSASVASVKALIQADYASDPANVRAVLLFGHVPVPYSGNIAPDSHEEMRGAWPADSFYGDMNGLWTDNLNLTPPGPGRHSNVAGDGKYDQDLPPSPIELTVGRVDLWDMPSFAPKTERDLLRQYLEKNYRFRHKLLTPKPRGIIDDNFGAYAGEAFASSGWRAFSAFFGSQVFEDDWFTRLAAESFLWGYACGGGSYTSASGVGTTADFALKDPRVVFTMIFGSYHGDWDTQDNFLRAPLATTTFTLTSAWAGRPAWYFHHMGMGETIGYSTRVSQDNRGLYWNPAWQGVQTALMGDPTLRMHVVGKPTALTATPLGGLIRLAWTAPIETLEGFHVYRSSGGGPFARLTPAPIALATYDDGNPPAGTLTYMVRSVKLEETLTGSYFNASQGEFVTATASTGPSAFYTLTPCRVVDTRLAAGPLGGPALAANSDRLFPIAGTCGIPSTARAVALNVTATESTTLGDVRVSPGDSPPMVSAVNYQTGQTRAHSSLIGLDSQGRISVRASQPSGTVHLIVDVTGFFR